MRPSDRAKCLQSPVIRLCRPPGKPRHQRFRTELSEGGNGVTDGPTTAALIEIEHLTKRFGHLTAVDDVSFSVARGEVLGFLGPNGAGKSTTMRMLAGFMPPTSGTARICGHDVQTDSIAARRTLGFLPEGAPTYPDMTVDGFLRFVARVRGYGGAELHERMGHVIALTHLDLVLAQPIETLSKGFK